jgi:hypothetical protein
MPEATFSPSEADRKDLLESDRLKAITNLQQYQTEMKAWRDKKVKQITFDVGDLVLLWSPRIQSLRKLESKWDGPYAVTKKSRPGSYHGSDSQGKRLAHSWNADNLRRFYI